MLFSAVLTFFISCSGGKIKKPDTNGVTIKVLKSGPKNPEKTDKGLRFVYRLKIQPLNDLFLTGGFNGWTPNDPVYKLSKGSDGLWSITVKIDKGRWEYKFVVDGQQFYDSFAKKIEPDNTGRKK